MKNKNIKNYIKQIIFLILVSLLMIFIFFEIFFPRQTINVFGFKPYTVITKSMEPVLMENDLIFVKKVNLEELKKDDIITFYVDIYNDGDIEVVTHYINLVTEVNGERVYRTNGYNLPRDAWSLNDEDILGEYVFRIPYAGKIVEFIRSPFGIAAIIVNLGVIITIVYLLKKDKKSESEEVKEELN